jgi:Xaa-Pro aminopeptidase
LDDLYAEKMRQATGLLAERDLDAWLLFVRETDMIPDPSLALICDLSFVWETAIYVSRDGRHAAVAGLHDCDPVCKSGLFAEVLPYTASIRETLNELFARRDPRRIAVNYAPDNPAADGLTHGMFLRLHDILGGTPYPDRLVSSDALVTLLRGRKSPAELGRMRAALRSAEAIWQAVGRFMRVGRSEREIAGFMLEEVARRGLTTSWAADHCPSVHAGAPVDEGHSRPGERRIEPGTLINIDFGVRENGYCTDQQRMWYARRSGESEAPPEILKAFDAVCGAIQAAATVLRPGVAGWEVDAVARQYLIEAGYPEYPHALGHTVGRATHDGGTVLGPHWDRYGALPDGIVQPDQVFTLEPGVETPYGYLSIEEEVLVTEAGCDFLSPPQMELNYI